LENSIFAQLSLISLSVKTNSENVVRCFGILKAPIKNLVELKITFLRSGANPIKEI